jgi:hypothetical protein
MKVSTRNEKHGGMGNNDRKDCFKKEVLSSA